MQESLPQAKHDSDSILNIHENALAWKIGISAFFGQIRTPIAKQRFKAESLTCKRLRTANHWKHDRITSLFGYFTPAKTVLQRAGMSFVTGAIPN